MQPIRDVAARLGIGEDQLLPHGRHIAKLAPEMTSSRPARRGKFVLVTGTTPTKSGEGKTLTVIGLTQALTQQGVRAVAALRQPSMGPVFGAKGGATGSGRAGLLPAESINLHFTGDFHAVSAAQNLLAALLDAHRFHGNKLQVDDEDVVWPRALDMNDRQLRHIRSGLGGPKSGVPRNDEFVVTAATEMMAIFALASDAPDLRRRIERAVLAYDKNGNPVTAAQIGGVGGAVALMRDALMPNLVQTSEGAPVLIHAGPFANISHGTSSVIASRAALGLADVVVSEAGFGADLGGEKFIGLVASQSDIKPDVAVLITSVRTLREHGLANLDHHAGVLEAMGLPVVVTVNRFNDDTDAEVKVILDHCAARGRRAAVHTCHRDGGAGGLALADAVRDALAKTTSRPAPLYAPGDSAEAKIAALAKRAYGADGVDISDVAMHALDAARRHGYGHLPICVAKTPLSLSADPALKGVPHGWRLPIRDVQVRAGAGYLVAIAGDTVLMPGLSAEPAAFKIDVDADGRIVGL